MGDVEAVRPEIEDHRLDGIAGRAPSGRDARSPVGHEQPQTANYSENAEEKQHDLQHATDERDDIDEPAPDKRGDTRQEKGVPRPHEKSHHSIVEHE